jgi:hypothetical protein
MAKITNDLVYGATITMTNGLQIRVPNAADKDVQNCVQALFALASSLDERLAALEKRSSAAA